MSDDNSIKGPQGVSELAPFIPTNEAAPSKKDTNSPLSTKEVAGKEEFLTLLVHQLQNQDPLNPMDNQEFAVQLAQFSQLEQLIAINDKIGGADGGVPSASSLASFLGHEVVLDAGSVSIEGGTGPNLVVNIPQGAQSGRLDFIDSNGATVGSASFGTDTPGQTVLPINGANVPNGTYEVRAMVVNSAGSFEELDTKVTGTVEGFVVEPEPALLINGEQVALADVKEVYQGQR